MLQVSKNSIICLFIELLTKELFKCHKHLKLNSLLVYWAINKKIVQMSQTSKTQFFACLLSY